MPNHKLCITTTSKDGYSETFIRNHIKHLPFEKKVLYGGVSPVLYDRDTNKPLYSPLIYKAKKYIAQSDDSLQNSTVTSYLSKFLRREKIEIVLAEFGPVGENIVDACIKANVPLVVHFHGDDAHGERFLREWDRYQKLVTYAKAAICVSEPMKDQLLSLGFSESMVHLIPYGIDTSFFSTGNPQDAPPSFLAVGRFVDKKAPHLLILAFQQVLQQVSDATLTFIGTGPLLSACQSLAKALGISEKINFKGACPQDEVQWYLQQSRAFLMHSITPETGEKEGTPLSILEASASGLPVVSTRHAGIPQAIIHDKTGLLVNEFDIKGMASYIITLAQNPELAQRMGKEGRAHISTHYEISHQIAKLAAILNETRKKGV